VVLPPLRTRVPQVLKLPRRPAGPRKSLVD
jgi:hypothetical protein